MRILFFIDSLNAGGKERRCVELLKGLNNLPCIDFQIVVMNENIHYREVFALNTKIHFLIRKTKKDLIVFRKFYKTCREYKPDIVHCWNDMTAVIAIPTCKLLHIKLINGMVADAPVKTNLFKSKSIFYSKITFPFSDIIVSNSRAGLNAYNAPYKKSEVIYNGYNFERNLGIRSKEVIKNEYQIDTEYIVGMIASFSKFKDYKTYYEAASLILRRRKDVTFLSIGNDTDSSESVEMAGTLCLDNHFRLLGKKSDIESIISIIDIGVLATFTEGISNAILECMAQEKPVIATFCDGTSEIIDDSKTGFLVATSDATGMADKIEVLLKDSSLRKQMGESAKRKIQDCFTIEEMVNNYITLYSRIKTNTATSLKKKFKKRAKRNLQVV
jgi:glycosyltransferase involved in cell wall biosynthesis